MAKMERVIMLRRFLANLPASSLYTNNTLSEAGEESTGGSSILSPTDKVPKSDEPYQTPASTALFFLFGFFILFSVFQLHRMHKYRQRQEEEDAQILEQQAEINLRKDTQRRRKKLTEIIKSNELLLKLGSSHFSKGNNTSLTVLQAADMEPDRTDDAASDVGDGHATGCTNATLMSATSRAAPKTSSDNAETSNKESTTVCISQTMVEDTRARSGGTIESVVPGREKRENNSLDIESATCTIQYVAGDAPPSHLALESMGEYSRKAAPISPCRSMASTRDSLDGQLTLPRGAATTSMVPNLCAICLESYYEGETIVWSSNKSCPHAFHQKCILDYLIHHEEVKSAPCPCCRQVFLPKPVWRRPKTAEAV